MSHESGDWEQICGGISSHLLKQVIQDLKRERLLYEGLLPTVLIYENETNV